MELVLGPSGPRTRRSDRWRWTPQGRGAVAQACVRKRGADGGAPRAPRGRGAALWGVRRIFIVKLVRSSTRRISKRASVVCLARAAVVDLIHHRALAELVSSYHIVEKLQIWPVHSDQRVDSQTVFVPLSHTEFRQQHSHRVVQLELIALLLHCSDKCKERYTICG